MRIRVKVNAGARGESVRELERGYYQVRTRQPAEAGRANARALQLLADELGRAPGELRIVAGATRPVKVVEVDD